jgi:hypothetical protein
LALLEQQKVAIGQNVPPICIMVIPSGVVVAYDPGRVFRIGMAHAFHGLGWCKDKGHVILNAYRGHSCVGVAYLLLA